MSESGHHGWHGCGVGFPPAPPPFGAAQATLRLRGLWPSTMAGVRRSYRGGGGGSGAPGGVIPTLVSTLLFLVLLLEGRGVGASWTDYVPHETCGAKHALKPPVLFYGPPAHLRLGNDNTPADAEECTRNCARVRGAGTALYYAKDATVRCGLSLFLFVVDESRS